VSITVDTTRFEAALKDILKYTSRETALVINSIAIEVITTAAELTKKADPAEIERKLTTGVIARTHTKTGKVLKRPKVIAYKPAELVYMILNARQRKAGKPGLNNAAMSREAQKLIRRRRAASGFTAYAGWQRALQAVGGRGFGRAPKFDGSSAAKGYGIKATPDKLMAKLVNTATAIEIYGVKPLQEAIDLKTAKMIARVEAKLAAKFAAEKGR
jgi:uncharacterized small protein (DUF1192 family)